LSAARPTIRQLLLALALLLLGVPLLTVGFLPVFDAYLLRQTERILLSEGVMVGEVWRDRWLAARGLDPAEAPEYRPLDRADARFAPFDAVLDLDYDVLEPRDDPQEPVVELDPAKAQAGREVRALLERAQSFNLSGVRVLDERGCVLAASRGPVGYCIGDGVEVVRALAGSYAAVVRRRISDEPSPPITSIRRRGSLRVFTAIPIFSDGNVVAVVRMSRTAVSPVEALWTHRDKVGLLAVVCIVLAPALVYGVSHAISRPIRELHASAEAVGAGGALARVQVGRLTPRELEALDAALARMHRQLAEREQYILEFATQVSHELKTPIAAITGAVELLREQAEDMSEAQRERFLANVADDAERMDRLVRRLLELARIESSSEEVEHIDVGERLEGFRRRHPDRIELDVEPDLALEISESHFETALGNLIDNALRHGAGAPVRVSAHRKDGRILFEVGDRGPGIAESARGRVFERFYTTQRDRGGSGLGLALVRAVADSRDGRVDFETSPGGTTFRLVL